MSTRQELFGNEHEREPDEEGDRDRRRGEMGASCRLIAYFYNGPYASELFVLKRDVAKRNEGTHSGMIIPNPAPRSSPDPRAVSLDIEDPTTS